MIIHTELTNETNSRLLDEVSSAMVAWQFAADDDKRVIAQLHLANALLLLDGFAFDQSETKALAALAR